MEPQKLSFFQKNYWNNQRFFIIVYDEIKTCINISEEYLLAWNAFYAITVPLNFFAFLYWTREKDQNIMWYSYLSTLLHHLNFWTTIANKMVKKMSLFPHQKPKACFLFLVFGEFDSPLLHLYDCIKTFYK